MHIFQISYNRRIFSFAQRNTLFFFFNIKKKGGGGTSDHYTIQKQALVQGVIHTILFIVPEISFSLLSLHSRDQTGSSRAVMARSHQQTCARAAPPYLSWQEVKINKKKKRKKKVCLTLCATARCHAHGSFFWILFFYPAHVYYEQDS